MKDRDASTVKAPTERAILAAIRTLQQLAEVADANGQVATDARTRQDYLSRAASLRKAALVAKREL